MCLLPSSGIRCLSFCRLLSSSLATVTHRPHTCLWHLQAAFGLLFFALAFVSAAGDAKRVLVVHSFVNSAPPFTTHSTAFETTLTAEMGERIDLDEVSLDVARYTTLDMEEAL